MLFFMIHDPYLSSYSTLTVFLPTGPHSPQSVTVDSVGAEHVNLSWNISAFMQTTPHSYNVTICDSRCETVLYSCTNGSAAMSISISHLTSGTKYFLHISAFVVRPDSVTGGNIILQSNPTTVDVKTGKEVLLVYFCVMACFLDTVYNNWQQLKLKYSIIFSPFTHHCKLVLVSLFCICVSVSSLLR